MLIIQALVCTPRGAKSLTAGQAAGGHPLNLQDPVLPSMAVLLPALSKGDQMEKQAGAGSQ